ncbi:MAG: aminotransferase class V-fold PLP-dependent enzyme [Clostridia bacterium]|nr:aminotransferase class V-fold PLP-dependent enzyme [Clostridia bacterium]
MYRFNCDYLEGAHPRIIERLCETNLEQTASYGADVYSESAKKKIKEVVACDNAKVFFLVGGTQANYCVLDSILKNYEGVIAADTGHISVHEAGAIEFSGHKVLTIPNENGKLVPEKVRQYVENFYSDATYPHMVRPGAVYISHPTEYGTLYSKDELKALRSICNEYGMKLYLDGARLGYALASDNTDVALSDIAKYCHAFYIGGTKVGALFGEAVVFTENDGECFFTEIKQHGALLAKGRMLGLQFDTLFTDGLYMEIGKYADSLAMKIKKAFTEKGYKTYFDSYTNQQFFVMSEEKYNELSEKVVIDNWGPMGEREVLVRITTSWATEEAAVDYLLSLI